MGNVLVNPKANNIFAFWESPNPIPAYLDLCKDTWVKNIPNCEIHILNHSNLDQYIGDIYDIEALKTISFAMQSDIISAAVLEKFGGLFLDIDCIVIDDLFRIFNSISDDKLIAFGRPEAFAIHLAVLYCKKPNNPILAGWRAGAQKRLQNIPEKYDWSFFGNAIVNPLLKQDNHQNSFIVDRLISGNILETVVFNDTEVSRAIDNYKHFYFNEFLGFNKNVLSLANFGVISLHNSWTPPQYQAIKDKSEFLQQSIPIAGMLDYVLKNDIVIDFSNSIIAIEAYLRNQLTQKQIAHQVKYFRSMLVIDLVCQSLSFAFDIKYQTGGIEVDLVLRNFDPNSIKRHQFFIDRCVSFVNNKCNLGAYQDSQSLLEDMLIIREIIEKVSRVNASTAMIDGVYIDLENLSVKDNLLFIEGIAFIEHKSAREYADIDYQLLFMTDGLVKYTKQLAKAHNPSITQRFATNDLVNYDKCQFTTMRYAGVDIADLAVGSYQLCLYIKAGKVTQIQPIRSIKQKQFESDSYQFDSQNQNNIFVVKKISNKAVNEFSNQKIKIEGDYIDSKNNKIIAPKNLHNCFVQFFGINNEVIIDNDANLKNCTLEMRENGKVVIKKNVGFHGNIRLGYGSSVEIGNNTTSTNPVYVTVAEGTKLVVGDDCMFATNNQIRTDDAHAIYDINTGRRINPSQDIVLGDHVWVGYGAVLFGGTTIGSGSVVGAFSVVNKAFSNNCIIAGTPAKVIKENVFWKRPLLLNKPHEENEIAYPSASDRLTEHF